MWWGCNCFGEGEKHPENPFCRMDFPGVDDVSIFIIFYQSAYVYQIESGTSTMKRLSFHSSVSAAYSSFFPSQLKVG